MSKKSFLSVLAVLAMALWCSTLTFAQDTTGSLTGTVRDVNGAGVPNATVTITDPSKSNIVVRTVTTDSEGSYSIPSIAASTFTVTVEAANFKKSVNTDVKVEVSTHRTLDIQLTAGRIDETVTVTADEIGVQLSTPTASTVINGDQVRELSLNNRNFAQLITLSPGVSPNIQDQIYVGTTNPNGVSNALQIAVNGTRSSSNTYTVDGADTTDRGSNLTVQTYPSVDAIQEFSVLRSLYPAESGRSSGGQVNVITKSGGKSFHGDLYEFWRNEKLNANSFIANRTSNPALIDSNGKSLRAPFRYNNFGGTLGGPIPFPHFGEGGPILDMHNTFFFFSEEVRRVIVYPSTTTTVPSAALRQGVFSQPVCVGPVANPCTVIANSIPQSSWSPLAAAYVQDIYNKLPLPDATNTLFYPTRGIFNFRQDLIRLDHKFSDKVSAYYRFENDDIPTIEPFGLFAGGAGQPNVSTTETQSPGRTHVLRATWVPSSNSVLEFGASYSYGAVLSDVTGLLNNANSPDIVAHLPAFAFTTTRGRVPTIGGNGFSGLSTFGPYSNFSHNKSAFITFSKIFGSHTTKYGFNVSGILKHENSLGGTNEGTYGAVSATPVACTTNPPTTNCQRPLGTSTTNQLWANFLLGNFQTFTQNQFDLTADLHSASYEAFAQDEWKIRPNITLYYGLRFSRYGQPWDGNGRLTSFDPLLFNASQAFQVSGNGNRVAGTGNPMNGIIVNSQASVPGAIVSPWGKSVAPTRNNFAPRIGIAWDPFKKGTTSVRAGYGIYHDQLSFSFEETGLVATNPPFQQQLVVNSTTLDNPLAGNPSVSLASPTVAGIDPDFKTPYVQSWSLDVQHQFGSKTVLTVGYYGSKGVHLTGLVDANLLPAGYAIGLGATACAPVTSTGTAPSVPCQAPGQVFTTAGQEAILNQIRPFRGFTTVRLLETRFDSIYHSLQVSAQRRFSNSSQVNLAYTWSKNLTDSQNESATSPQNTYDIRSEWGRANLDRRHVLSVNYIYEVPFFRGQGGAAEKVLGGWQISGLVYYYTGLGFTAATSSNDPAGLGLLGTSPSGARPDQICDPNQNAPHLYLQWFNTACFANPPAGVNRVGNAGRNTIDGPPTTRFDATLSKKFRFTESMALQLRWEVFNIFNHTNFTTFASSNVTSATYGQINATRDPRTMQLGAKFIF